MLLYLFIFIRPCLRFRTPTRSAEAVIPGNSSLRRWCNMPGA